MLAWEEEGLESGITVDADMNVVYPQQGGYYAAQGAEHLEGKVKQYSVMMAVLAVIAFCSSFSQKWAFGSLGQNVTLGIRQFLYNHILQKHMGFFDDRANATGILTSAMAKDTSVINGVSAESLGPVVESVCAMGAGLGIGFYYCW